LLVLGLSTIAPNAQLGLFICAALLLCAALTLTIVPNGVLLLAETVEEHAEPVDSGGSQCRFLKTTVKSARRE
jgi:hypothetical protein